MRNTTQKGDNTMSTDVTDTTVDGVTDVEDATVSGEMMAGAQS